MFSTLLEAFQGWITIGLLLLTITSGQYCKITSWDRHVVQHRLKLRCWRT